MIAVSCIKFYVKNSNNTSALLFMFVLDCVSLENSKLTGVSLLRPPLGTSKRPLH